MPHSVSSNDSPKRDGEDEVLPDAPPESANAAEEQPEGTDNAKPSVKLEDLFNDDDDDDDDEFPTSSAADFKTQSSPPPLAAP
jgi:DNA primase small subunit